MSGWYFVSVPKKQSAAIRKAFAGLGRGFGSLPVRVTVGMSTWRTSIFPDSKTGTYLLALKAEVRKKEKIGEGSEVRFSFSVRMNEF
jgi:hypothetical protein